MWAGHAAPAARRSSRAYADHRVWSSCGYHTRTPHLCCASPQKEMEGNEKESNPHLSPLWDQNSALGTHMSMESRQVPIPRKSAPLLLSCSMNTRSYLPGHDHQAGRVCQAAARLTW